MSITAPRIRLISRAIDGIPPEDITLALSTRLLKTSYTGPCVQVRRDPPENALNFVSKVDGVYADRLESVAVSAVGDLYVVGRQRSATFYDAQGTVVLSGLGLATITPCIAKYAANGSPVWRAGINGNPGSINAKIAVENEYIFAHSYVDLLTSSLSVYSSSDVVTLLPWSTTKTTGSPLVKYTSDGDVAWAASVRSEVYNVIARGVASDQASGAYVCGSCTGGAVDTVSNVIMYDSAGAAGATLNATGTLGVGWLGRYNSTGNVLWATSIVASECNFSGVVSDGSGGVVACGDIVTASGTANVLHANGAVFTTLTSPQRTPLIVKYDAAGTALAAWVPTASTSSSTMSRIASDGTGNVYIGGSITSGRNVYNSDNALAGQIVAPTGRAVFVIKFDSDLNAVWWTSVDGAQTETPTSVAADANGVYLTGTYATTAGGTANIYHANAAVAGVLPTTTNGGGFFVKYSPSGTVQSWNSTSSGSIEGVALDSTRNRAMVVGYSASGTTANILNQSGTILSSITGTGEAGFLSAFQLGSTLKDIGFKGRSLDISALKTHCPPGSNGYVQTWYSQSPQTQENPNMATATLVSGTNHRYELLGHFTNAIDKLGAGVESYKAFNKQFINFYDIWHSASGLVTNPKWISFQYPVDVWLVSYTITARNDAPNSIYSPFTWEFQGSNDGSIWTTVNSQTEIQFTIGQSRTFPVSSVATYKYYRLYVTSAARYGTSGGYDYVAIGDMKIVITNDARQNIDQPLLVENGIVKTNSTGRPSIDFTGSKRLVVPYDATANGTPTFTYGTSGLGQSTYTTTITSGEVIGTRTATPTLTENQQFAYGSTPNTLSSARATIGSTPVLDTLSQHAQTSCLAAFSFRRLFLEYKGPVVRLRRESDNAERDFYGCPSAIEIWIGASSARVVTLWDQSGNGKHASQVTPTNQPLVTKQYGVYVAHFNGTVGVPQFMTFADIYPASFWSQYYINQLRSVIYATLFARAGDDFGFRRSGVSYGMTGSINNDFLGADGDTKPYWIINRQYGSENQLPNSVPLQVWNRVTGSRMTESTQPISSIGRGYTPQFRDLNGYVAELVFWSKPALVSDALLLDASPLVKTTSSFVSQTLNTTIGRLGAIVGRGFTSILDAVQIMSSFSSSYNGPRTVTGSMILNNQDFGSFQYIVKRGSFSVETGYNPLEWFSSVKDTAAAIVVIDGNLTIGSGCIFTPPVRKLFYVLYITGNLVLDGEISMTARGANHNATPGESGFSSVFPAKDILVYGGEYGDLFGATNAFVPAGGASGGVGYTNGDGISSGTKGALGSSGGSAGGGAGGYGGSGGGVPGSGAGGTSFSGGTGGGGSASGAFGFNGEENGGLGGEEVPNPGRPGYGYGAGNGPNGTGGTLFVIVSGTVTGSGKVTSHGSVGFGGGDGGGFTISGGGSGGGSAWLLAGSGGDSIKVTATGGDRARVRSGLGGNGSAMKISLRIPSISTTTRSSVVGAYSLRRLMSAWGGPVVRVRHGTTNEQRDFYSEDLDPGAALDTFLAGATAFIQTWYDQSGSNRHASQTTLINQPSIVRDASWTTKPTVRCGGTGFLNYNGAGLVNSDYTVAVSTARTSDAINNYFMSGTSNTANQNLTLGYLTNTQLTHTQYGTVYNMTISGHTSPTPETYMFRHSATVGKTTYRNGTLLGSSVNVQPLTGYVGAAIGRAYAGDISEVILASSYVSDIERPLLETSMMSAL